MTENWVEVFRAGQHTDSRGKIREWTEADLDFMVSKYNPATHEAPVVVGHPKDNSPAYGWVESLTRKDNILLARFRQVVPEFAEAVKTGLYKKRSISIYPDGTLRHVGFLGGQPPAVKGLADIAFTEEDLAEVVEYGDGVELMSHYEVRSIGRLLRRIREWMISKFGIEEADKVMDEFTINEIQNAPGPIIEEVPAPAAGFNEEAPKEEDNMEELKNQLAEAEKKLAEFAERESAHLAEIATLKADNTRKEINARLEVLQGQGKVTPGMRQMGLAEFMAGLSQETQEYQFSEGTKETPAAFVWRFLENLSPVVELKTEIATPAAAAEPAKAPAEFADLPVDETRLEMHNLAVQIAKEKKISYNAALAQAMAK